MGPFDSGWAQHGTHGTTYGESYISLYVKELTEMFQMGKEYSYDKMSADKMHEHPQTAHLEYGIMCIISSCEYSWYQWGSMVIFPYQFYLLILYLINK